MNAEKEKNQQDPAAHRRLELTLVVNGVRYLLHVAPQDTLLDVLREDLGLTGAKRSCDVQVCGTCTVLLEGEPVSACNTLAYEARDKEVLTIEGLATGDRLHPIQEAFIESYGFQCGFCTPGMILTAWALLRDCPQPSEEEIKHYMRGNLCRCTGYRNVLASIRRAAEKLRGEA